MISGSPEVKLVLVMPNEKELWSCGAFVKIPLRKVFEQARALEVLAMEAVRAGGHEKSPEQAPRQLGDAEKEKAPSDTVATIGTVEGGVVPLASSTDATGATGVGTSTMWPLSSL